MRVSAIAAMDRSGAIGIGGRMPWHLPRDLKRFRRYTWDKPVIMGRNTCLSLAAPLAGRYQIVLTRKTGWLAQDCHVVHSVDEALAAAAVRLNVVGGDETMIIGGGQVFQETLSLWDRVYLTVVEGEFEADAFFPVDILRQLRWRKLEEEWSPADAKNPHPHRFIALERLPETTAETERFDLASWLDQPTGRVCEPG
jgi:dihydrofolate reductase